MSNHLPENPVAFSWATSIGGWTVSAWLYITGGMAPLAVFATVLTILLTCIKLVQEYFAWRTKRVEYSAAQRLLRRLQEHLTKPGDLEN